MSKKPERRVYEPPQRFTFEHNDKNFRVRIDATLRYDTDDKKWDQTQLLVAEVLRIGKLFQ